MKAAVDIKRLSTLGLCQAVRPSPAKDTGERHLFLSWKGRGLSKNVIWEPVRKHARRARTGKTVTPHTFRHTVVSIVDLKGEHGRCHQREEDAEWAKGMVCILYPYGYNTFRREKT